MLFLGFPQDCLSIRAVDGAQQSEALRVFVVARQTEKADPCPAVSTTAVRSKNESPGIGFSFHPH